MWIGKNVMSSARGLKSSLGSYGLPWSAPQNMRTRSLMMMRVTNIPFAPSLLRWMLMPSGSCWTMWMGPLFILIPWRKRPWTHHYVCVCGCAARCSVDMLRNIFAHTHTQSHGKETHAVSFFVHSNSWAMCLMHIAHAKAHKNLSMGVCVTYFSVLYTLGFLS